MRKKILLIDCFDSFTFNLKHYLEQFCLVDVLRIDIVDVYTIDHYDALVLSPGPKLPSDYPQLNYLLSMYASIKPIFGVCLGMQAIGEYFGGELVNLEFVKHGLSEKLYDVHLDSALYHSLKKDVMVARYHSWVIKANEQIRNEFDITSWSEKGEVMSFKHKSLPIYGVQYHPESIMTPYGLKIIENWVNTL